MTLGRSRRPESISRSDGNPRRRASHLPLGRQGGQWPSGPDQPNEIGRRPEQLELRRQHPHQRAGAGARKVPPGGGWRRALYNATFGLVNLGQSPAELRQAELEAKIRTLLRGNYKVGVLGKGGVGKTTVAAAVGSIFADTAPRRSRCGHRRRYCVWQARSPRGPPSGTPLTGIWLLTNTSTPSPTYGRGSATTPLACSCCQVSPPQRGARVLDPAIYREATARLDRHFTISIVDCGSSLDAPVTQEALRDIDALIVVSSPWVDGASAAGQTLEWLANRGMMGVLHRTVVVLNDSDGHANRKTRTILAQQFASRGQVVIEVPFDSHLRPGGVIDVANEMAPKTRRSFYEIAAAVAEQFADTTHGPRDQRPR